MRGLFFDWLEANRPDLMPRYKALYRRGAYMPAQERERLSKLVMGPDLAPDTRMRGRLRDADEPDARSKNRRSRSRSGSRRCFEQPGPRSCEEIFISCQEP